MRIGSLDSNEFILIIWVIHRASEIYQLPVGFQVGFSILSVTFKTVHGSVAGYQENHFHQHPLNKMKEGQTSPDPIPMGVYGASEVAIFSRYTNSLEVLSSRDIVNFLPSDFRKIMKIYLLPLAQEMCYNGK